MDSIISYLTGSLFCGALFYLLFVLLMSGKSSYNFSIALPEITIASKSEAAGQVENIAGVGKIPLILCCFLQLNY